MRSLIALLLLVCVIVTLFNSACDRSAAIDADRALVVYASGPRGLAEKICASFTQQTGVRIELFSATTGQIMAKLEAERFNQRADVVILASRLAAEHLKREGLLDVYRPPMPDGSHEDWHDPDGAYHATAAAAVGIALRAELQDPALEWDDLFGGRFAGRVTMPSPSRSGAAADFVLAFTQSRGDGAWERLLAARRAGLEISGANSQAIAGLLTNSHQAIVGAVDYLIYREIARGAPIVMHFPASGAPIVERPVAILKGARSPEHARRFVDHCFTPLAQGMVSEAHLLPAILSVAPSDVRGSAPTPMPLDLEHGLREQRSVLRRFQNEVERVMAR